MTRLKEIRTQKGLTQAQVSELLDCSTTVYSRYETGDRQPSIDVLISLSKIFNVSIDYIVNNPWSDTNVFTNNKNTLTSFDMKLIRSFHNADHYDQITVLRTLKISEKLDIALNA